MYDERMPRDATDTKQRLLRAAVEEFAGHGLAGARVDRIAETAAANKRSIYMHFGTKEELFDKVVADSMVELAEAVSVDAGDLPTYAGELFEQLERQQPIDVEVEEYRRNVAAIRAAQDAGEVRADIPALELMAMAIALVISWDTASWSLKALQAESGHDGFTGRKAAVAAAVAGLVRPLPDRP